MKKKIAFYCCTNGLGHFKRVNEIAKYLTDLFKITIYCNQVQAEKIGKLDTVEYIFYSQDNIKWNLVTQGHGKKAIDTYFNWLQQYGPTVKQYDIVVSDNLVGLCDYGNVLLMGSFFWKDVFNSYIGENLLSKVDERILSEKQPVICTNKYVETQSIKEYPFKFQSGFGCEQQLKVASETKHTIIQYPSLPYLEKYNTYLDKLFSIQELGCTKNLSYIYDTRIIARPGVGTITHCVEYRIPLIALYSNKDSAEIIELAHIVEELKIGYKQNIEESLDMTKIKMLRSNTNFCYVDPPFELNGYSKIANYIKKL
jgi:hypothetical protein